MWEQKHQNTAYVHLIECTVSKLFRSMDKIVRALQAVWINPHLSVEFIIACTGGVKQTHDLGRSNRKITCSSCQAKSCMMQHSRIFNLSVFSGPNDRISWHTLSEYQSVRKLQVLSAACSLPADLIPPFHLSLSPSEMELCHLLGHQSRIKSDFQKPESHTERKWEHPFTLLQRNSGLSEVYVTQRPTVLEKGCI